MLAFKGQQTFLTGVLSVRNIYIFIIDRQSMGVSN